MQFSATVVLALLSLVSAAPHYKQNEAEVPILFKSAKLAPQGCTRYVKGYDITGVTTEVDLTFAGTPSIRSAQDCFDSCASSPTTSVSWVWKFSTDPAHRTCTLYSNFNLPSAVNIAFNVGGSTPNINANKLMANTNNPQNGVAVPPCTRFNSTIMDHNCLSGMSFMTSDNKLLC